MNSVHEHNGHEEGHSEEELTALLKYLVKHNTEHTSEMAELAASLKDGSEAKKAVAGAVELYNQGNEKLSAALTFLTEDR